MLRSLLDHSEVIESNGTFETQELSEVIERADTPLPCTLDHHHFCIGETRRRATCTWFTHRTF
jgi:hypothetical protein